MTTYRERARRLRGEAEQRRTAGHRVMSEIAAEIEDLRARAASLELESTKRVKGEAKQVNRLDRAAELFERAAEIEIQLAAAREAELTAAAELASAEDIQMSAERRHNDLRAVAEMASSVDDDADPAAEVDALARHRAAEELVGRAEQVVEQARQATVIAKAAADDAAERTWALQRELDALVERGEALAAGKEDPAETAARKAQAERQRAEAERKQQVAAEESRDRSDAMTGARWGDMAQQIQADQLRRAGWHIPGVTTTRR